MKNWYDIPGWFDFQDIYSRIVNESFGGVFVEVGSWLGRSALYFAEQVCAKNREGLIWRTSEETQLHCVDTWEGSEEHKLYVAQHDVYAEFCENVEDWIRTGLS